MAHTFSFDSIFSVLPEILRKKLQKAYNEIRRNFRESRFEPSELNGAKLAEVVIRILEWHTSASQKYTPFGNKIRDFGQSLRRFESMSTFPDSVRFHIPDILKTLYGVRNKRGVGHVSGDVDPNRMDAQLIVTSANWVIAELVRLFHQVKTEEATQIVEEIISKETQLVWDLGDIKRVLDPSMSMKNRTLLLLHTEHPKEVEEAELFSWVEHSHKSVYRRDILKKIHNEKLVEYNQPNGTVILSPTGLDYVESNLLQEI